MTVFPHIWAAGKSRGLHRALWEWKYLHIAVISCGAPNTLTPQHLHCAHFHSRVLSWNAHSTCTLVPAAGKMPRAADSDSTFTWGHLVVLGQKEQAAPCLFDKLWQNYPSEVFLSIDGVSEAGMLARKALQTSEHGKWQNRVFLVHVMLSAQNLNNCCGLNPRTFKNPT